MFVEQPFESDEDVECPSTAAALQQQRSSPSSLDSRAAGAAAAVGKGSITLTLHTPRDAAFRFVCGADSDDRRQSNPLVASGDAWGSKDCHCLRCSLLRVAALTRSTQMHQTSSAAASSLLSARRGMQNAPSKIIGRGAAVLPLVLLDLDNYGFPHFFASLRGPATQKKCKREPVKRVRDGQQQTTSPEDDAPVVASGGKSDAVHPKVWVWCFYSSCFVRHFKVDPKEAIAAKQAAVDANDASETALKFWQRPPPPGCIWASLAAVGCAYFTPCAAHKQAADGAIVQVCAAVLGTCPVVVVSGDKDLCRAVRELHGTNSASERCAAAVVDTNEFGRGGPKAGCGTDVFRHICTVASSM
jgi:hypothetical protein